MDEDAEFVTRALGRLPAVSPPAGLTGRILAAYDGQPRAGWWQRVCELVWPGAPAWAPASAFGAALLAGAVLGAVLPAMRGDGATRFSLDQPASFDHVSPS